MNIKYKDILRDELQTRLQKNGQYSLRSFARDAGIDPGFMSHVMNGKRHLSLNKAVEISHRLGFKQATKDLFQSLVRFETSGSENAKIEVLRIINKHKSLNDHIYRVRLDQFDSISEWYHNAILEMSLTAKPKLTEALVVKRLGISRLEAKLAIARLTRLELLVEKEGKLVKRERHIATDSDIANAALKKRHGQILSKAKEAVYQQRIEDREFQSMTLNIDPKLLPEAKKKIRKFMWDLCEFLESGEQKEIFEYSTQLFSLEKNEGTK